MSDSEGVAARKGLIPLRLQGAKSRTGLRERRRSPRPRLAEIRRGANLNLLPPTVVTGAVRVIEFLVVVALGFAIYLGYVASEGQSAHLVYFAAVVTAAVANTLMPQAFDLYSVPAFSAFVRSFARTRADFVRSSAGCRSRSAPGPCCSRLVWRSPCH